MAVRLVNSPLLEIADILITEDEKYKALLKKYLEQGLSYPAARYHGILDYYNFLYKDNEKYNHNQNTAVIKKSLSGSNSILAIEYLKALKLTKSRIIPITVPRIRSSYSAEKIKKGISSATSIRKEILNNGMTSKVQSALPEVVFQLLSDSFEKGLGPIDNNDLEDLFLGILRRSSLSETASWMDVGEGLENRIKEQALRATSLKEFLSSVKTKRYTHTRIQRILIHGLLNLSTNAFRDMNNKTGSAYHACPCFSKKPPSFEEIKKGGKSSNYYKVCSYISL